ncbi:MAG: hypothetical protein FWF46_01145 [Oscillospiraceae bacterium]|nr:hypothetical protein [Oscillospiraceae bacterium]
MLYPYVTLGDGTEILHTQIFEEDGVEKVEVHFEKPINNGFMSARFVLPTYELIIRDNVSDEEIAFFIEFLEHNVPLIYEFARAGGAESA